jgi:phage terminase small subunit
MARKNGGGTAVAAGGVVNNRRGQFAATGQVTKKQRAFIYALVRNGGNKRQAAIAAGYDYARPDQAAAEVLRSPHVREALRQERERVIAGDLAPLALETMRELMTSADTPAGTRFNAARYTLEAAGHNSKQINDLDSQDGRSLEEMGVDELERVIAQGNAALESYRREQSAIDVTPDSDQTAESAPVLHDSEDASDVLD